MSSNAPAQAELLPGISEAIGRVNQALAEAAARDNPVFFSGEPGTERILAAKLIHSRGARARQPIAKVSVNWKVPTELAVRFQQCAGGTLILHMQREFPADMQYALLEMANDKSFIDPVSGDLHEADVRLVVVSNVDLDAQHHDGTLLPELAELVRQSHIVIPAIRERPEDIPALVRYAVKRARETGKSQATGADAQVLALFRQCLWPGNAEDLLLVTAEAAINCHGPLITLDDVPQSFLASVPAEFVEQARQMRLPRVDTSASVRKLDATPAASAESAPTPAAPALASKAPAAAPLSDSEVEAQADRLQRLFVLAKRLHTQSQVLREQMAGPVEGKKGDPSAMAAAPESPAELSSALEGELDRSLEAIMALRRQLAVLNEREKKAIDTARDLYKQLMISGAGERSASADAELVAGTQELAGELKHLDTIIQRVSGNFPRISLAEPEDAQDAMVTPQEYNADAMVTPREPVSADSEESQHDPRVFRKAGEDTPPPTKPRRVSQIIKRAPRVPPAGAADVTMVEGGAAARWQAAAEDDDQNTAPQGGSAARSDAARPSWHRIGEDDEQTNVDALRRREQQHDSDPTLPGRGAIIPPEERKG